MNYFRKLENYIFSKYKLIVIFLLLINFFLISFSVYRESVIWDEVCYIGMGKYILETGNFRTDGSIAHATLSYYINSLFLYFIDIPDEIMNKESCWERGLALLFESKNPIRLLFLIRLPLILLSVLLGFYVFKWAKELYGVKAGLFALLFYSFSPNIIANARFALTDFSFVCFSFISMYYFWKFCNKSTAWNLIILGFVTGLAFISKITALFLIPIYIFLGLIFIERIFSERIISILLTFLVAFFVVFAAYGFKIQTISNTLPDHYLDRANDEIENRISNDNFKKAAYFIIDKIPLPAATYFTVIGDVSYYSLKGFNGYFFGKIFAPEERPFYYFFGVILLKTPIPTLIILALSIIFFKNMRHKKLRNEFFLIIPIIVLLVGYMTTSLLSYPHYVAYFNELVQTKNGYKYLSGTNIDAGQNLISLKDFMDKHKIDKINFSFHGGISPRYYGIDYDSMPTTCFAPSNEDYEPFAANCEKDFTEDCSKRKGIVALSVTNLQNRFLKNSSCFNWLRGYEPISRLGYSLFVYNITK